MSGSVISLEEIKNSPVGTIIVDKDYDAFVRKEDGWYLRGTLRSTIFDDNADGFELWQPFHHVGHVTFEKPDKPELPLPPDGNARITQIERGEGPDDPGFQDGTILMDRDGDVYHVSDNQLFSDSELEDESHCTIEELFEAYSPVYLVELRPGTPYRCPMYHVGVDHSCEENCELEHSEGHECRDHCEHIFDDDHSCEENCELEHADYHDCSEECDQKHAEDQADYAVVYDSATDVQTLLRDGEPLISSLDVPKSKWQTLVHTVVS